MRIAFYTYSYIDRLGMEPTAVIPRVAAAGYDSLDLSATWRADEDPGLFPAERRREVRRLTDDHGLAIEALVTHLPLLESLVRGRPLNLHGAVDLAVELRAPVVTVHIGCPEASHGPGEAARQAAWDMAVGYLRDVCEYAAPAGVRVATDATFPDFLTPTPESVAALVDAVGSPLMGHNYDPCYLALCGQDPAAACAVLGRRVVHAHVKDHAGRYPDWEHRIPGEGTLDHGAWARALRETGFDGAAAVECFTEMPLERALEVGLRTVRAALETARPAAG